MGRGAKKYRGEGDEEQQDGGEVGAQQFHSNLPLDLQSHEHHVANFFLIQGKVGYCEHGQVSVFQCQLGEVPLNFESIHHCTMGKLQWGDQIRNL